MDRTEAHLMEVATEGAHARAIGRPKDSCPYPAESPEQKAWYEGFDGTPSDDNFDSPIEDA